MQSGLVLTPRSFGVIIASTITSFSLVRWGYRRPMLAGLGFFLLALVLLMVRPGNIGLPELSITLYLSLVMVFAGLATGISAPASNNSCIELLPSKIGSLTSVRSMFGQGGTVISITICSLVLENFGMSVGFRIIFMGMAALLLLMMAPAIYILPAKPTSQSKI
jgi:MFS family permease